MQIAIDSYSNHDEIKSKTLPSKAPTASSDSASVDTGSTQPDEDEEAWRCSGRDTTEDHGTFITHDDDFLVKHVVLNKTSAVMMQNQREIFQEDDDGNVYGEFTGHEGATDEVYEEYHECAFSYEEDSTSYDDEYKDYTYDASTLYWWEISWRWSVCTLVDS